MAVAAGEKFGPYEILAHIGEGGMGEVYRARDTRLNRSVAIKVLPQALVDDPARMQRFEQEARTVATLNHPNILVVYDVGVQEGTPYLVMELLEGETLRERLNRGPIPVRKAVEIGLQIAHGLSAAHEHGIVHRDLKPENIFVTRDGHTKLLDFGLAKTHTDPKAAKASGYMSDMTMMTGQAMQTEPGVVMGTAPYMAPEQVRGEAVDYRADIFSFGAVMYEMLSGKPAFPGATGVEIMTAVLRSDPPEIDQEHTKIPPGLERIVRHCLEKDPNDRFQSARDLSFALGALSGSESSVALHPPAVRTSRWPLWSALAAAVLVAIAATSTYFLLRTSAPAERLEFAIPVQDEVGHIALSPDGSMLAYVAVDENTGEDVLFVQPVGSPDATRLSGTEGATYPFWSPNDDYVAFFAQGRLKKIPATGGATRVLASASQGRGGSWSKKDVIIYAPESGGPLWRVDADGTDAAPLTDKILTQESSHRWPVFLPDGEHFLFWAGLFSDNPDDHVSGIYLSSLSDRQHKELEVLAPSNPGYSKQHLLYVDKKGALVSVPFDIGSGKIGGKPQIVSSQVGRHPSTYWGAFSVAENGTVVFHQRTGSSQSQLTWFDRSGKELGRIGDVGLLANPGISPDGSRLVFDVADNNARNIDVWIHDIARNASTRFTFDPAEETTGVWSRDGKTIAYRSAAAQEILRVKNSSGFEADRGQAAPPPGAIDIMPTSFANGHDSLLATVELTTGGTTLDVVSLADKKVTPFLPGRGNKADGQISPDGKWVAYESDESGEWEVYISPYPGAGGKLQVSRAGGTEPRWRGDGKEIFYLDPKGTLVSVSVNSEGSLSAGSPVPLFQTHARAPVSSSDLFSYDVTPDGKSFLVDRYVKPAKIAPLSIVLNAVNWEPSANAAENDRARSAALGFLDAKTLVASILGALRYNPRNRGLSQPASRSTNPAHPSKLGASPVALVLRFLAYTFFDRTTMRTVILLLCLSSFAVSVMSQTAASTASVPSNAPSGSTSMTSILPDLDKLQAAATQTNVELGRMRVEKWKADPDSKRQAQGNAESVQRNLTTALPGLIDAVRSSPQDVTAEFKLYRNLNALYDVFVSVTESAGAFGPRDQYEALAQQLTVVDDVRRDLGNALESLAASTQSELTQLRTQVRSLQQQAAAPPPPTKKVVVDDNEPPKKTAHKKKPATKPAAAPSTSGTDASSSGAAPASTPKQ